MRYTVIFVLLLLLESAEFKGGRGGGGGFKFMSFKKAPGRVAKTKQKVQAKAPAKATENDVNKYFNRDVPFSQRDYGMIFGKGLSKNSYIYNNYYRTHSRTAGIAQFLTNALFLRTGMRLGREMSQYDEWNENDDKRWRLTTKAPYFQNKIPGEMHD